MRKYRLKSALCMLMVSALLLTGCGGSGNNSQSAVPEASEESKEANVDLEETDGKNTTEAEDSAEEENAKENESLRFAPEWTKDAVIYEVNVRQYTEEGTFAAFSEHLQEIKDMGINTIWFMPIHPISETNRAGTLGSYYSITDYKEINPEFGTKEDFKAVVDKAHEMGFHVMMDWVANHTGWDCPWITEHPDWYTQVNGEIISPEGMGWPDVADLNYDNVDMRKEMIACMQYWVEEFDIDGYRCDYANGVPKTFWEAARNGLYKIKPVYMLAEDDKALSLLDEAFDVNYNWPLYDTLIAVAKDSKPAERIQLYIPDKYPEGTYALNFLDNHDKNSYEHTIMEGIGKDAIPAMFALIYTIPGVPLVYTGDEIGLDHSIEFMEKDPIDWNSSDVSYREVLAALGAIRSRNTALYSGNYGGGIEYYNTGNKNVFCYSREKDGNIVKCVLNLSKREQTVDVSSIFEGTETVVLHGQGSEVLDTEERAISEEKLSGEITLNPWEFWIAIEDR